MATPAAEIAQSKYSRRGIDRQTDTQTDTLNRVKRKKNLCEDFPQPRCHAISHGALAQLVAAQQLQDARFRHPALPVVADTLYVIVLVVLVFVIIINVAIHLAACRHAKLDARRSSKLSQLISNTSNSSRRIIMIAVAAAAAGGNLPF